MMRNVNCEISRIAFSLVKFNRFVIVEFQFTFHYRDKCLGNEFKNLFFGGNTIKHFCSFVKENSENLKISWRLDSLWNAKDQQKKKREFSFFWKEKSDSDGKIKRNSYVSLFFAFFCLHDCLKWLAPTFRGWKTAWRVLLLNFILLPPSQRELLSFSSGVESNDYCLMW